MANAHEPLGQHVQEKAANELVRGKRHHLALVAVRVIAPAETHRVAVETDEPVIRDRHPVRIAGQIIEHGFGAGERRLRVDDPVGALELGQQT